MAHAGHDCRYSFQIRSFHFWRAAARRLCLRDYSLVRRSLWEPELARPRTHNPRQPGAPFPPACIFEGLIPVAKPGSARNRCPVPDRILGNGYAQPVHRLSRPVRGVLERVSPRGASQSERKRKADHCPSENGPGPVLPASRRAPSPGQGYALLRHHQYLY